MRCHFHKILTKSEFDPDVLVEVLNNKINQILSSVTWIFAFRHTEKDRQTQQR